MKAGQHDLMRKVEDEHWWYRVLRGQVLHALERSVKAGGHVLDAGCGTGGMLSLLRGWESHGCDLSAEAVEHCRARGLERVLVSSVHSMPYADCSFDAVLSLDVLYHARVDEHLALSEMRRVLRPGGRLIVNVPAFECLRGDHDTAVEGVRRYRLRVLERLLRAHDFVIEQAHYWNAWLFLPLLLRRLLVTNDQGDLRMPPRWLNEWLAMCGSADAALCRLTRVPWGTSVFLVARSCAAE